MGSTLPKSSEKAICLGRWESPWNQGGIFRGDLLVSGRISETPFRINGFPCYFSEPGDSIITAYHHLGGMRGRKGEVTTLNHQFTTAGASELPRPTTWDI